MEYRGDAFSGALKGKLLVVRYSAGQDIMVLDPGGPGGKITFRTLAVIGLTGFNQPLDLAQDVATGSLYVTERRSTDHPSHACSLTLSLVRTYGASRHAAIRVRETRIIRRRRSSTLTSGLVRGRGSVAIRIINLRFSVQSFGLNRAAASTTTSNRR